MPLLQETEAAVSDLAANRQRLGGAHFGQEIEQAVPGLVIGEAPYDPARHLPSDINPLSIMELVADRPHVKQVIPHNPLEVNIVVHNDRAQQSDPVWMTQAKLGLAQGYRDMFEEVLPSNDRVQCYVIGEPGTGVFDRDTELVKETDDPLATAKAVAEICRDGLSIVISTFKNLPLEQVSGARYDSTVGVKANHLFEVDLQPGVGKWATGDPDMPAVNTHKPKELEAWNKVLQDRHRQTVERLEQAGMAVAQIIFDPRHRPYGFNVVEADQSMAAALGSIGYR